MPPVARTPGITGLPGLGSPLMAQLVKFLQARNPAVLVNEGNVGEHVGSYQDLDRRAGTPFRVPGAGRNLLAALVAAGLALARAPRAVPAGQSWGDLSPHQQSLISEQGANARGVGQLPPWTGFQSFAPIQGASPQVPVNTLPAQVPVNTLPGSSPGGVQPPPLAQTPVGPMFYPPGPSPLGARDPRRNYLFG